MICFSDLYDTRIILICFELCWIWRIIFWSDLLLNLLSTKCNEYLNYDLYEILECWFYINYVTKNLIHLENRIARSQTLHAMPFFRSKQSQSFIVIRTKSAVRIIPCESVRCQSVANTGGEPSIPVVSQHSRRRSACPETMRNRTNNSYRSHTSRCISNKSISDYYYYGVAI